MAPSAPAGLSLPSWGATNLCHRATARKESPPARPRRRAPLQPELPEPEQPAPEPEPAQQHPAERFPESAGPAADFSPAPQPAEPVQRRVCAFCGTPQPLSALSQVATWLECADRDACDERARRSDLYARSEDELAISRHEIAAGALR